MTGHGAKLGRKQEETIAALLTQRNTEEAARAVGISPKTFLRWMKVPGFDTAYREARRAAFGQCIARLQQGASAAATLLEMLIDPGNPSAYVPPKSILSHANKAIEIEDVEARVSDLERVAELSMGNRDG
jgi:hypothetical protein